MKRTDRRTGNNSTDDGCYILTLQFSWGGGATLPTSLRSIELAGHKVDPLHSLPMATSSHWPDGSATPGLGKLLIMTA